MSLPEYFQPNMYITDLTGVFIVNCGFNCFIHKTDRKLHCLCIPS